MNFVQHAIWYVESHFGDDLVLDDLAAAAGVSRFHLVRAFGLATGQSPMQYLRARRLSEAAQRLAAGVTDILALALDARYGSHEAFTRAFRDQFGLTPEAVRSRGRLDGIRLTAPIRLDETLLENLDEPREAVRDAFLLAGLNEALTYQSSAGVPGQWQRFAQEVAPALRRHAVDATAYGVLHNSDDAGNLDYLCGMEVRDFSGLPPSWSRLRVAPLRYAVFVHAGHVSAIRRTWFSIWNRWLPASGCEPAGGLEFERYGPGFDLHTGVGDIEIWLPVADRAPSDVVATDFYGVRLTSEQQQGIHVRGAQSLVDAVLAIDARTLAQPRPGPKRLASRCDHYTRLLTAMLRAKGIPARARCGFADYFRPGRFEDHWVCEYWHAKDARWVMVDAQLDEVWRKMLRIDFSPLDLPRARFVTAGQAWQRVRQGEVDASFFGLSFVNLSGLWYVAGNVVREAAALNKMEILPWDVWGAQPALNASLSADQLSYFDSLTPLTLAPDTRWAELRARYAGDDGLRVPAQVFNAIRQRMEASI